MKYWQIKRNENLTWELYQDGKLITDHSTPVAAPMMRTLEALLNEQHETIEKLREQVEIGE